MNIDIQSVISRLEATDSVLASDVRKAFTMLAGERDQANARARDAEAQAHDMAVASAKAKLEANGVKAEQYQSPLNPQRFMLRADFDKLDSRQKYDAIMKERVKVID